MVEFETKAPQKVRLAYCPCFNIEIWIVGKCMSAHFVRRHTIHRTSKEVLLISPYAYFQVLQSHHVFDWFHFWVYSGLLDLP